jgi:hypothetical protein
LSPLCSCSFCSSLFLISLHYFLVRYKKLFLHFGNCEDLCNGLKCGLF